MRWAIREMTDADADAVAEARVKGWRHAYAGMVPAGVLHRLDAGRIAAWLRTALADGDGEGVHLVAETADEGVIGWASAGPYRPVEEAGDSATAEGGPGSGELYALYLLPAFIGRGVGRALMAASLAELAARGHGHARLWVLRDNAPARRFYERAGFRADGAANTLDMDGTPVIEVRYVRTLP